MNGEDDYSEDNYKAGDYKDHGDGGNGYGDYEDGGDGETSRVSKAEQ